jgi:hypothetical protein
MRYICNWVILVTALSVVSEVAYAEEEKPPRVATFDRQGFLERLEQAEMLSGRVLAIDRVKGKIYLSGGRVIYIDPNTDPKDVMNIQVDDELKIVLSPSASAPKWPVMKQPPAPSLKDSVSSFFLPQEQSVRYPTPKELKEIEVTLPKPNLKDLTKLHSSASAVVGGSGFSVPDDGTQRQVEARPVSSWHTQQAAGTQQPDNPTANVFKSRFADLGRSIAGIFKVDPTGVSLLGTAFLVRKDLVATAGHVVEDFSSGASSRGPGKVTSNGIYLIFNLSQHEYKELVSNRSNLGTARSLDIVQVKPDSLVYIPSAFDVGFIKVPEQPSTRQILRFSDEDFKDSDTVAVLGVPDLPKGTDQLSFQWWCENYIGQKDKAKCLSEYQQTPLDLRVSTGAFCEHTNAFFTVKLRVNTNMGNSGSPVFQAGTGLVKGMIIENPDGPVDCGSSPFNTALVAKQIVSNLTRVP